MKNINAATAHECDWQCARPKRYRVVGLTMTGAIFSSVAIIMDYEIVKALHDFENFTDGPAIPIVVRGNEKAERN